MIEFKKSIVRERLKGSFNLKERNTKADLTVFRFTKGSCKQGTKQFSLTTRDKARSFTVKC